MSDEATHSPRLTALREQTAAGDLRALIAFWRQIEAAGAPLVERIAGDERHVLVTFLWRETGPVEGVVVVGGIAGFDMDRGRLSRLPGTNVWHWTCRARSDLRMTYRLAVSGPDGNANWLLDPLNPQVYVNARLTDDGEEHDPGFTDSVLELPDAASRVWLEPRDVPHGQVEMHRVSSAVLENSRRVWVYTPPGYATDAQSYPLLVLSDGETYIQFTPTVLDNLIAAGAIPPLVAVLVANPTGDITARLTELTCCDPFADFLSQELIPWVRETVHVSTDPAQAIIAGSSLGGLNAAFIGLRHPELFGNVLSQSGSFWWRPEDDEEHIWLARQYLDAPPLPLRFYLEVGVLEVSSTPGNGPSQIFSNRHLRDVLRAKGYPVVYSEYGGGHSMLCWRVTLVNGLIALLNPDGPPAGKRASRAAVPAISYGRDSSRPD